MLVTHYTLTPFAHIHMALWANDQVDLKFERVTSTFKVGIPKSCIVISVYNGAFVVWFFVGLDHNEGGAHQHCDLLGSRDEQGAAHRIPEPEAVEGAEERSEPEE